MSPGVARISGVACGGGKCVAVGDAGTVSLSDDLKTWRSANTHVNRIFQSIAWGNGVFVASGWEFGRDGFLLTSADAVSWAATAITDTWAFNEVTFLNGKFIATASDTVLTSFDALTWQRVSSNPWRLHSVIFGAGLYVAASGSQRILLTSPDAEVWTPHETSITNLSGLAFGNSRFVALAHDSEKSFIFISGNGSAWHEPPIVLPRRYNALAFGKETFVIAGDRGAIATSVDGAIWTPQVSGETNDFSKVVFTGDHFFAIHNSDFQSGGAAHGLSYSADAIHWTSWRRRQASLGIHKLFSVGVEVFALAQVPAEDRDSRKAAAAILSSTNGREWRTHYSQTNQGLADLVYGKGTFVTVGNESLTRTISLTSPDGRNWTTHRLSQAVAISDLAFGDGIFIAAGRKGFPSGPASGQILVSSNGMDWSSVPLPGDVPWLLSVAFGNSTWVVGGYAGTILTSTNAISWVRQESPPETPNFYSIFFGNGRFVANSGASIHHSTNGIEWTSFRSSLKNSLGRLSYSGGIFWLYNWEVRGIGASQDGTTWRWTPISYLPTTVAYVPATGRFISGSLETPVIDFDFLSMPRLETRRANDENYILVDWSAEEPPGTILQRASNPAGPWLPVEHWSRPFWFDTSSNQRQFFRKVHLGNPVQERN